MLEYANRNQKSKRDPYYQKPIPEVLECPSKPLSKDEMTAIRTFLPFFIDQRLNLQRRLIELTDKNAVLQKPAKRVPPHYYGKFDEAKCKLLLEFVEIIVLHSLVLLMSSSTEQDRSDFNLYKQ